MREGGGIATGIGLVVFFYLLLLPLLLLVFLYAFFSIYAMTKGTAFSAATINLPVWFAGVVVIPALLLALLMGAVSLIGRSLHPSRRRREP
jgi:glycerol-3-phosphate acyltransferase PlsY